MDTLPIDVSVRIYSFLSGEDVFRYKQLNRTISKVITENSLYLRRPLFSLTITTVDDKESPQTEKLAVLLQHEKYREWAAAYNTSDPTMLKADPYEGTYTSEFFDVFYQKEREDYGIKALCKFLLEKGDITQLSVFDVKDKQWIHSLNEALKNSPAQIRQVFFDPNDSQFEALCDILETIAAQKRQNNDYPKIRLVCESVQWFQSCWPNIRKLNEIAKGYRECWLEVVIYDIWNLIPLIAQEWKKDPIPEFFFYLSVQSLREEFFPLCLRMSHLVNPLESDFHITMSSKGIPLYITRDNLDESVRLGDLVTGNVLQFCMGNGIYFINEHKQDVQTVNIRMSVSLSS